MTAIETTTAELLEQLADRITTSARKRDHGIAWTNERIDLRDLLPERPHPAHQLSPCPVDPETKLMRLEWEGMMGMSSIIRVFTVALSSGRELIVSDLDFAPATEVLGVIDGTDPHAHVRAFQAVVSGEHIADPPLVGFPVEVDFAFGGVVLLDAVAKAFDDNGHLGDNLEEEACPSWALQEGEDARATLIEACEDIIEDDDAGEAEIERATWILDEIAWRPAWLWAIGSDDASRISAWRDETPPIPLYSPPGVPESLDPVEAMDDSRFRAAAYLVTLGLLP